MRLGCLLLIVSLTVNVGSQKPTLRDLVVERQDDVSVIVNVEGPSPAFDQVVGKMDLFIRARIGHVSGQFTEDARDIFTIYQLSGPQVLFASKIQQFPQPGRATEFTFRQRGGTVGINGFKASVRYDDTDPIDPG